MKIDIADIESVLRSHNIEPEKKSQILSDLEKAAEEEKAHKEKKPRVKSSFTLLQPGEDKQCLYLVKTSKEFDFTTIEDVLDKVRVDYNGTKRGLKSPVKTRVETLEVCKPKQFKPYGVQVLTKEPVLIVEVKQ